MYAALKILTGIALIITASKAENPSYDQRVYKPEFLNYCYEDREECKDVCGCVLDRKCIVGPIPSAVVEVILDKHNTIRKNRLKTEPKASGMPRIEYDAQLEAIARCWTAKCRPSPTDCLLTESYSEVSMNFGLIKTEDMNASPFLESPYNDTKPLEELWKTMLDEWIKEIDTLDVTDVFCRRRMVEAQRGAQMIHDQSLALGCSWSSSPEGYFFFCAYGPGMKNRTMVYKTGPSCSTCPPGLKCTGESEGLCIKYSIYPDANEVESGPGGGGDKKKPPRVPTVRAEAHSLVFDMKLFLLNTFVAFILCV